MRAWLYHVLMTGLVALALVGVFVMARRALDVLPTFLALGGTIGLLSLVGFVLAVVIDGPHFGAIRLLAWMIFLYLPALLIGTAVIFAGREPVFTCSGVALSLILGLIAVDAFLIEPHWLEVTRVTLPSPKVDRAVRVVVIADIQTDRPGAYERRALRTAMDQSPDLLLFAGDMIHLSRRSRAYEAEIAALNDLMVEVGVAAPLGTYAVRGNVDRAGAWTEVFAGVPVEILDPTETRDLGPVTLTGLSLADAFGTASDIPPAPGDAFHIVMGHSPNFSLGSTAGDLLIAGHTHGGQVQLPLIGPLVTLSQVPRRWASGVTSLDEGRTLVVSRGVGLERGRAPQFRFLCRPQIVVIEVVPG
jgi:hypothetical protein